MTADTQQVRGNRKVVRGVVSSNKMNKTIVVLVERQVRHPQYNKFIRRNTTYYAHDENNEASIGDEVEIMQTRPLSKLKRWRLLSVIKKAD